MAIPLKYNIGNISSRRVSTLMSVLGIGIVVAVMLSMMALSNGVNSAIVSTGSKDNLMIMRLGSDTELDSWVDKSKYQVLRTLPGIQKDAQGQPVISPETIIVFKLPKKDDPKGSNVNVRGVTPMAFEMRPYLKVIEGRMFRPGVNEVIVARRIRDRFLGCNVGDSFHFGSQDWNVVGIFDGAGTSFDSEIWTDVGYLGSVRKRESYSTVIVRPADHDSATAIKASVDNDNRLKLQVKSEYQYYDEQTSGLIGIKVLVGFVTFFMVIGATLGAMNTMFTAVATRTRELATLRALGFKRRAILMTVVIESAFVSLLGGVVGVLLALPVNLISTGTTNFKTFSEVAFNFNMGPAVALRGILLAVVAGVIGGLLPAISAARLPITRALREI
jgi:putative ABC transport system permease protein